MLLSEGAEALTLEAVARRAGVSKGGLFYHFPTKQALVAAMVDRLTMAFAQLPHALPGPRDRLPHAISTKLHRFLGIAGRAEGSGSGSSGSSGRLDGSRCCAGVSVTGCARF
ncbi:TetR/AcrR family transcriptional regulator [Nonomuraea jabiensis]|uniref:TetR/AcrR family transcriptional regulator n=1 Tax=Nonomuraea jabiensis TaxID=882448 RepID=UPI0036D04744